MGACQLLTQVPSMGGTGWMNSLKTPPFTAGASVLCPSSVPAVPKWSTAPEQPQNTDLAVCGASHVGFKPYGTSKWVSSCVAATVLLDLGCGQLLKFTRNLALACLHPALQVQFPPLTMHHSDYSGDHCFCHQHVESCHDTHAALPM